MARILPVILPGQSVAVAATALISAAEHGPYVLAYTLTCTTLQVGAATAQLKITYTGDQGATILLGTALSLQALGRDAGFFPVELLSGNINWEVVTTGTPALGRWILRLWVV